MPTCRLTPSAGVPELLEVEVVVRGVPRTVLAEVVGDPEPVTGLDQRPQP